MPDEILSKSSASKDPAPPETSLADLLPEFFETPSPIQNSRLPVVPVNSNHVMLEADPVFLPLRPVPVRSRENKSNYVLLAIVAVIGMIVIPLIVIGVFFFIANNQPAPTTVDVVQATTPLVTVFSITPAPGNLTSAPAVSGTIPASAASKSPAATQCPPKIAFGSVELYSCSQPVQANSVFSNYFGLAELQLAQTGQNSPAGSRIYAVSGDSPTRVLQFYATLLTAQGYALAQPADSGTTSLGQYSLALYAKGSQQVQVTVLTVNKASPDGQVKAGQTLIRLSSS